MTEPFTARVAESDLADLRRRLAATRWAPEQPAGAGDGAYGVPLTRLRRLVAKEHLDDGRVLVIRRRDNGRWEPPGGVLELDETFEAGVRREVHEETASGCESIGSPASCKNALTVGACRSSRT